jgi:hypothetical protein
MSKRCISPATLRTAYSIDADEFLPHRRSPNSAPLNAGLSLPCRGRSRRVKSPISTRSIVIAGHKTSVTLEDAFWNSLKETERGMIALRSWSPRLMVLANMPICPQLFDSLCLPFIAINLRTRGLQEAPAHPGLFNSLCEAGHRGLACCP